MILAHPRATWVAVYPALFSIIAVANSLRIHPIRLHPSVVCPSVQKTIALFKAKSYTSLQTIVTYCDASDSPLLPIVEPNVKHPSFTCKPF